LGTTEVSEFEDIVIKSGTDGTLVKLKDVGRAELGSRKVRFCDLEAMRLGIGIFQIPGSNALDVAKR